MTYSGAAIRSIYRTVGNEVRSETFTTNALGIPTTHTDALGNTTRTTVDAFGRTTETRLASGRGTRTTYDARDLPIEQWAIGRDGEIILMQKNTYDAHHRLRTILSRTSGDHFATTTLTYDADDRIVQSEKEGVTTTTTYDGFGQVVAERTTTSDGSIDLTTSASYDENGNRIRTIDERGNLWTSHYDGFDRLIATVDPE
jgi:YD repeat-containing protein